ncbi:hypothetical protein RJ639_002130 [Escallonia herrerae]|uniref:Reverse transcriptase/retrotransposon-derived protein RNase H-like domain-containing protein n=1 Tax=Escallonia herrerae TaxID=1293975 RepID=A0AA88XB99_9ASTE|nr:hypothetical protein RJ639_002130 [Escallonia herrerae]
MKSRPNKRNKDLWCHFHNDHGHTTDNCGSLKRAIEALIKRGQLRKFVAPGEGRQQTLPAMEERENQEENVGTINTISGGIAAGGSSGKARKAYARESSPFKAGNFDVKRVLIDNGSSAEILFHDAFEKMNIPTDRLRKMEAPLYGFSNHPVAAEGIIALPVAIGTPPAQANLMLDFVVVKVPSAYNAILGRPALNRLQAVVSTYHLKLKFPTEHGIGEVKGDQTTARQCYVTSCRSKNKEALIIEDLREDTKMQRGEPVKDLVSIEVYPGEEDKTVRIGSNLKEVTKLELVNLLRTYADIFAWTAADMPGIDPEIITHRLNVDPSKKHKSFQELKTYLSSPPLLSKPFPGEDLSIYLSVTEVAVSTVLIREEDGIQKPIYYISKVLQDVETRYPKIDKIALALIISARRLRPYFQSHTIVVLTDQPLRKVLMSPEASGRLVNWNLRVKTARYALVEGILYKKSFSLPYLRCLRPSESIYALQEVHEGICGQHLGGRTLAQKILRQGYYWPTMQKDAIEFTRRFTSVAHPQSNGQTENMNRGILQGLKKKLNEAKGAWVDELPKVLWAYRTTPHSVTGETPFSLCYGTEAMLPVEIGVPTIRALHFSELNNDVGLRVNLDLVEEARTQAHVRSVIIKQRVARYYSQKVRSKQFNEGDLVLRKLEVSNPKAATGKLSPNWEGPYRVIKVLKTGAYALRTLSGESIPRTWNAENLRRYYQ